MAVTSGRYRHPANGGYSEKVKKLIDACLVVDPEQRPDINKVSRITSYQEQDASDAIGLQLG
jgi:serine/threonine kinase 16